MDTHCHLDKLEFAPDRDRVVERARAAGVSELVVPAIGPEGWAGLAGYARATPGVHFGLGIHPQLLPEIDPRDDDRHLADLDAALARGGAVAVGECGLDGGSVAAGASLVRQVRVLGGHLALARKHRLPVVLHCLKLHDPLLALLRAEPLPAGGVLHSYSGGAEQVRAYLALGLYLSFAGPVTYEGARRPLAAVQAVPPDRLLLETDAPDQTPRPHRGRNEPAFLPEIAAAVARATGRTVAEVDAFTTANARALFRLPP
ncbi:TatD family hydrolase [Anaeromyxobacter sp. Fw109-5]|uniref:TatD family hydrolase n=1 Tax=Anaeromyxobacter sp. (strain Fw109-5) TaxID=404589 RepID=UPI001F41C4A0|nr:TatD family hydrolase [Anaeromyxobacter sp. Fw109-5]